MEKSITKLIETNFAEFNTENNCYGFYDWFCKDSSLPNKANTLISRLKSLLKHNVKFDPAKCYVFFRNNCPGRGSKYDDFRICDIKSEKVLYTVAPRDSHENGKASVWGIDNDFKEPIIVGKWSEIKAFFSAIS